MQRDKAGGGGSLVDFHVQHDRGAQANQEGSRDNARSYALLGSDGVRYTSEKPGVLGGNRRLRIYGRLDCPSAVAALARGYAKHRVFFADEEAALANGYRPCGRCMRERFREWRSRNTAEMRDLPMAESYVRAPAPSIRLA